MSNHSVLRGSRRQADMRADTHFRLYRTGSQRLPQYPCGGIPFSGSLSHPSVLAVFRVAVIRNFRFASRNLRQAVIRPSHLCVTLHCNLFACSFSHIPTFASRALRPVADLVTFHVELSALPFSFHWASILAPPIRASQQRQWACAYHQKQACLATAAS